MIELDWKPIFDEAIRHFQNILKINTTNPPGDEINVVRYLSEELKKEDIHFETVEPEPRRTSIIARVPSSGKEDPLLLVGHTDVVSAEADKWDYPPFAAEIHDGYLWGRGAIDMKHMVTYDLMTMLLLKRLGVKLNREIIFAAMADEENGSRLGAKWIVENRPDLIQAKYALNEVGGFTIHVGKNRIYPIQVAEKGIMWLRMTATGTPGHGSIPREDNAVVKLAKAIRKIHSKWLPLHKTKMSDDFINAIVGSLSPPASWVMKGILVPGLSNMILKYILPDRERANFFMANLHNTACPTGLKGSEKVNVIPSEASVDLDCRILPGFTKEDLIKELTNCVGKGFKFEIIASSTPAVQEINTPLYKIIKERVEENDPGCKVVPNMLVAMTDAAQLAKIGITTYGFAPLKLPPNLNFAKLFHGHNERIPISGFTWGLKTFFETVHQFCEIW